MSDLPPVNPEAFFFPGDARGVLLLHGFTGTPYELRHLGLCLNKAGYTVSAPLLPGHNSSPEALQESNPAEWISAAARALDELRQACDRVVVGGLSLGSLLALQLAMDRPELIHALMLYGTPHRLGSRLGVLLLLYNYTPMLHFKPYFPKTGRIRDLCDPTLKGVNPGYDVLPMAAGRHLWGFMRSIRGRVDELLCPCLLVHGERDDTALAWGSRLLGRSLGSDTIWQRYLPRSGHLVTLDWERHAVADFSLEFLAQVM